MARDVLLSYAHEIPIARATMDIDLAFAVDDWKTYEGLQTALLESGKSTKDPHMACGQILPFALGEREINITQYPPPLSP